MTAVHLVLAAAGATLWLALLARAALVAARMFQIEEYEARRLSAWARTRAWLLHRATLAAGLLTLAVAFATPPLAATTAAIAVTAAWAVGLAGGHVLWRWLAPKKELVFTARMRRLLATTAALGAVVAAALGAVVAAAPPVVAGGVAAAGAAAIPCLAVALLALANTVNAPVEARVRRGFLDRARRRLAAVDPLVIAVAGSYGKTSTKHILAHLLEHHGTTLATPKSFNTLMGVSRTVNEVLEDRHRTFIVEMDAYAPGEIAAICDLVHPAHAVLTSVGPQHLERFGTVERIADALYETVASLPSSGFAVIHGGDEPARRLAARAVADGHRTVTYGLAGTASDLDVVAEDVQITGRGSRFTWCWQAERLRHPLVVPLLGRHQVLNVTAALATVHLLGLPLAPSLEAVAGLRPVDHRLQPVPTGNAITVIDDSYNANPVGVHNGLEVLAELEARTRILVTPGLVELGSVEEAENRRYGEHAAQVCDHVILVDSRPARAVHEGLRAGGMGDDRIHMVRSLAEATATIARIAGPGDAVLFANDLPDTYLGAA